MEFDVNKHVKSYWNKFIVLIDKDEEFTDAIGEKGFRRIPVVEDGKPVGIISVADIVEHARTCTVCMTNILSEASKAQR